MWSSAVTYFYRAGNETGAKYMKLTFFSYNQKDLGLPQHDRVPYDIS